jgi:SAM-dependent methyltransferase
MSLFIKYKAKYSNAKSAIEYRKKLKELYPSTTHDSGLDKDYSGHKITYGEMDYSGIDQIVSNFPNQPFTSFLDIGSGRGKLCLYIASEPSITKSVGIELVTPRHDDALNLKRQLDNFNRFTNKVEFINQDFLTCDLSQFVDTNPLVWISNLCFDRELTNQVFNKLIDGMPSGTIIACSKQYTEGTNPKLKELNSIQVKMSWSESSEVHLYRIE